MAHPQRLSFQANQPLHGVTSSRKVEALAMANLPAFCLMQRAGKSVFDWARALYPHARTVNVVCGGGNNGGDGLVAALAWHRLFAQIGGSVTVVWLGDAARLPVDARRAWQAARDEGVRFVTDLQPTPDIWVDAMLGLGLDRPLQGKYAEWSARLQTAQEPVLCVDLPSGLDANQGHWWGPHLAAPPAPRHTLALLTLKPGLFTGAGRQACGEIWFDDLGVAALALDTVEPDAWLQGAPTQRPSWRQMHSSHKGTRGQVVVLGGQIQSQGQPGMAGAALLAARSALLAGAGRVYVGQTGAVPQSAVGVDLNQPELMFRHPHDLMDLLAVPGCVTVAGCGGGTSIEQWLPTVLDKAAVLVLDADALNAIAGNADLQQLLRLRKSQGSMTLITPHPLEAARLLNTSAAEVQQQRLTSAQKLANQTGACVVLKGSGSVVATPSQKPRIIPAGNGLLATAGTGDVLAGMIGAYLATSIARGGSFNLTEIVCDAVFDHGKAADLWSDNAGPLTASRLTTPTVH